VSHPKRQSEAQLSAKLTQIETLRRRIAEACKPDKEDAARGHIADMVESYPLLSAVMTAHLEKGGPEEGATILLWGKEEGLGGILNVKPLGVRAFIDAGSLVEWLTLAERLLEDPETRWQKDKPRKRPGNSYGRSKGRA
jgi:hypothetical protein